MGAIGEISERPWLKWIILFSSFYSFVAYAFAFQGAAPLFGAIMEEFKISNMEAGLLMSVVLVPGIFLSLPAGLLVGRYGVRRIGLVSLICITLSSLVTTTANSFFVLVIGRLILGIGGAFIVTTTPAMIAQWFAKQELGKVMGIFSINMPLSTAAAFPIATVAMLQYGWRSAFYVSLAIGVTTTAVFAAVVKEGPFSDQKGSANIRKAITNFEIWKVGFVWLFFNAAALSFTTWAPTLLVQYQNVPRVQASFLATLLMWAAIVCVPFFGFISDRTRRRKLFAILGTFLMTITFAMMAYTSDLTLIILLTAILGVMAAMVPPVISALPAEILGPGLASIGFGITGICLSIGAASAQPLVGFILDVTKSYTLSLLGIATLSAIGTITAYAMKTR